VTSLQKEHYQEHFTTPELLFASGLLGITMLPLPDITADAGLLDPIDLQSGRDSLMERGLLHIRDRGSWQASRFLFTLIDWLANPELTLEVVGRQVEKSTYRAVIHYRAGKGLWVEPDQEHYNLSLYHNESNLLFSIATRLGVKNQSSAEQNLITLERAGLLAYLDAGEPIPTDGMTFAATLRTFCWKDGAPHVDSEMVLFGSEHCLYFGELVDPHQNRIICRTITADMIRCKLEEMSIVA
jgi:hypothetical protein